MFNLFVSENVVDFRGWLRCKSVPEHLGIPALEQDAQPTKGVRGGLPFELTGVKGERIAKFANIIDGNLVPTSQSLRHHWDESQTLLLAIPRDASDLPLMSEAGLLGFFGNSSVLKGGPPEKNDKTWEFFPY